MILKRKTSNDDEDDSSNIKKDTKRLVRVDNGRGYSLVNDPLSLASFSLSPIKALFILMY